MDNLKDPNTLLRELDAKRQIQDVLICLCRGVDRLDRDLILSGYHPGAIDDHGSFKGTAEEFVDWLFATHEGRVPICVHHMGNIFIEFASDKVAHCESYVFTYHRKTIDGELCDMSAHGRYLDRFEERNGRWKITERLLILDWDRIDPVDRQVAGPLMTQMEKSQRSRADGSYRMFQGAP